MTTADAEFSRTTRARVLVLLCTYNEVHNLPIAIEQLQHFIPQADFLVVDDSSPDGTGEWVKQHAAFENKVFLISRPGKLGLGTALRDGIAWCLRKDYEFLLNLDADLSHRPEDAPAVLSACQPHHVGVSVGTRYVAPGGFANLAWHRKLMSRFLNMYATRLLRLPITDCSGSFRCYRVSTLQGLDMSRLSCRGYGFLEEILVALHRSGAQLVEVPIVFEARVHGYSKLSLRDAWGAIQIIHRLALRHS